MKLMDMENKMKPGDLIAFSGEGLVPKLIKWKTQSNISHVGCILSDDPLTLVESTTLKKNKGVSTCRLWKRAYTYKGRMWWCPLNERGALKKNDVFNVTAFQDFLYSHEGKPYDYWGAMFSALFYRNGENFANMFCSELVCGAWKAGGILATNCSEQTPDDVIDMFVVGPCKEIECGQARRT